MKILSFGEIIWDIYPDKKCIGGAPLNFAAHARKERADVYLLSAVGGDEMGRKALDIIKMYGINTELVSVCGNRSTGKCTVSLSDSGIPSYEIEENTAYDFIDAPQNITDTNFAAFVFGTLALRGQQNRNTVENLIKRGIAKEIFVDLNLRKPFYSKESIFLGLRNATILKVSDQELPEVMQTAFGIRSEGYEAVRMIADRFENIRIIVLTCGSMGSAAYDVNNAGFYSCSAVETNVVSTVGAGDSYGAAFLVNYLLGESIENCLARASEVSAAVVSRVEALPLLENS